MTSAGDRPMRVGVLLSGGGRTLENLAEHFRDVEPGVAEMSIVISDRDSAFGLERARRLGIPARVLPCRKAHREADSAAIFDVLEEAGTDLVVMGGYLKLLLIPDRWMRRIINIHPSLIPKFCGTGFYGNRVHAAVIEAGESVSGCTVHYVDNEYDHGPVLLQEEVPVQPDDTPDTLAARVFDAECRAFPRAVSLIARGRVVWGPDGQPHPQ